MIELNDFSEKEKSEIEKIIETNPGFLLREECKYFNRIKHLILPYIK